MALEQFPTISRTKPATPSGKGYAGALRKQPMPTRGAPAAAPAGATAALRSRPGGTAPRRRAPVSTPTASASPTSGTPSMDALTRAWSARRYDAFTAPASASPTGGGAAPAQGGYGTNQDLGLSNAEAYRRYGANSGMSQQQWMTAGPNGAPSALQSWLRTRTDASQAAALRYDPLTGLMNITGPMIAASTAMQPNVTTPKQSYYPAAQGWQG